MLTKLQAKYIQSLNEKKFRQQEGMFVAEGPKIVGELLQSQAFTLSALYATEQWSNPAADSASPDKLHLVTQTELEKISFLSAPKQVLGLFHIPEKLSPPDYKGRVTLLLDGIQDPGNLGTIIRIADWFGVSTLVASAETADLFNPKVVQATMGSIARVTVLYEELVPFLAQQSGLPVFAATLHGQPLGSIGRIEEGFLLVGNESRGIQPALLEYATRQLTIPRIGHAESLNAAVATGIILSHLLQVGG